jgi:iron complex transport system substrate-binding protein
MVAALGAFDELVAVSHECDYPPAVLDLPSVTSSPVDASASSLEIDLSVRAALERGEPVTGVDGSALRAANPDVILTQSLCEVCAVDGDEVKRLADSLPDHVSVLSLGGVDVAGVLADIRAVGSAIGRDAEADNLATDLTQKYEAISESTVGAQRPRVVCIEWLDPVFLAGHWVPELVAAAGGQDVGAQPGEHSRQVDWAHVASLEPDVMLVMPCGFDVERTKAELALLENETARRLLSETPHRILDGNAYTSRPGPRIVEAVQRIRDALEEVLPTSVMR